jgi:hypothetical protein
VHPSLLPPPDPADRDAVDPLLLADIAAGFALALSHAPRRTREEPPRLLLRTSGYAAWHLVWSAGAAWECDHPSAGVIHIVRGELHEQWTDLLHLDHDHRVARAGDTIAIGRGMATRLENRRRAAASVVLVSSPPGPALQPRREQLRLAG